MSWLAGGWQIMTEMAPDFELVSTLLEGPYDEGRSGGFTRPPTGTAGSQKDKKTPLPTGHREDAM